MVTEETAASSGSTGRSGERERTVAVFAVLGAASGAVATGLLHGASAISSDLAYKITDWLHISPLTLLPGVVFGLIVGFALHRRGAAGLGRVAAYTVAAILAYFAAVTLALAIGRGNFDMVVIGLIAGLFGAACLAALGAWLFPFQRRAKPIVLMVAAGCLLGALLPLWTEGGDAWWKPFLLYVPWQAGYAAAFATSLPVGGRQSGAA